MSAHPAKRNRSGAWAITALLLFLASPVWPCSVPVFRYALERWAPSDYELWIFHRGPLTADQQRLAQDLDRLLIAWTASASVGMVIMFLDRGAAGPARSSGVQP